MKTVLSLTTLLALSLLQTQTLATILPENDLHLEDNLFSEDANMTEEEFSQIIDEVGNAYEEIVSSHGGALIMNKRWTDSTVNASANQSGVQWHVNMYGGLARRPEVTPDGFALVVCHELGHHLAGFPLYTGRWAASEGQSDYFATQACARRVWGQQHEKNALSRATVKPIPKAKCDEAWSEQTDRDLCYRSAMGGESLAKLLAALGNSQAEFETPDTRVVTRTQKSHPRGQCRLDTYFAGALCAESFDPNIIPGRNHPDGQDSLPAERQAAKYSCTQAALHNVGTRPTCWFKPELQSLISLASAEVKELSGNGNGVLEPNESADVLIALENSANRTYTNITANISSKDNKFEVVKNGVRFDTLSPNSKTTSSLPFIIKLGDLTCGEPVDMNFSVEVAPGKSASFSHSIQTGKMVSSGKVTQKASLPIPDGDRNGIASRIAIAPSGGNYTQATVTTDITHTYRGDLVVVLRSPAGKLFTLHNRKGGSKDDLKETFTVDLPKDIDVNGSWTLQVTDTAKRDTGTLNGWSLAFTKAVCE